MNKQTKQDLKNIGLTAVVINGQKRKDMNNKTINGLRGGDYGPYTATGAWQERNKEVRGYIEEVMIRNGYTELTCDWSEISFQNGKEIVKFYLMSWSRNNRGGSSVYWWVLV